MYAIFEKFKGQRTFLDRSVLVFIRSVLQSEVPPVDVRPVFEGHFPASKHFGISLKYYLIVSNIQLGTLFLHLKIFGFQL